MVKHLEYKMLLSFTAARLKSYAGGNSKRFSNFPHIPNWLQQWTPTDEYGEGALDNQGIPNDSRKRASGMTMIDPRQIRRLASKAKQLLGMRLQ